VVCDLGVRLDDLGSLDDARPDASTTLLVLDFGANGAFHVVLLGLFDSVQPWYSNC